MESLLPPREPISFVGTIVVRDSPQLFCVENVLLPATCKSVSDEVIFGNHINFDFSIDETLDSVLPRLIKGEAIYPLQDVDAGRGLADLESRAVHKISRS